MADVDARNRVAHHEQDPAAFAKALHRRGKAIKDVKGREDGQLYELYAGLLELALVAMSRRDAARVLNDLWAKHGETELLRRLAGDSTIVDPRQLSGVIRSSVG